MKTHLTAERTKATQVVVPFTGEGAYHGSTKPRRASAPASTDPGPPAAAPPAEMQATTLGEYAERGVDTIESFDAVFPNRFETVSTLGVPTQQEVRDDGVTFCWCPLDEALPLAGPLTRRVLLEMQEHLAGGKRYVYVDAKIQYFEPGDVPVDSQHWHVDGSITARGAQVQRLGHGLLHDMRARLLGSATPPQYLAYQSSEHCATMLAAEPVSVRLPDLIPNFDELDAKVRARKPRSASQPAGAIVRFDGLSLHRAVAASAAGWRLWVRAVETDRKVQLTRSIIECYGTVFRT